MTEDEAKTKACCGSGFRPMENGLCIASACMAWRWTWSPANHASMEADAPEANKPPSGHCGLAAQP